MKKSIIRLMLITTIAVAAVGAFGAINGKDQLRLDGIEFFTGNGMYEALYQEIINDSEYPAWIIEQEVLDKGYLLDHVEDFKAAGKISQDYVAPGASATTTTTTATAEPVAPEPFAVVDCEPYPGWAIKDVNLRSGASTKYDKVGGLSANEEVTVTGVASTGWLRITTKAGTEAYVSNNFITTENPNEVETTVEETTVEETTVEEAETVVEETTVEEITSVEETEAETETETIPEETASEEPAESGFNAVPIVIGVIVIIVALGSIMIGIGYHRRNRK